MDVRKKEPIPSRTYNVFFPCGSLAFLSHFSLPTVLYPLFTSHSIPLRNQFHLLFFPTPSPYLDSFVVALFFLVMCFFGWLELEAVSYLMPGALNVNVSTH